MAEAPRLFRLRLASAAPDEASGAISGRIAPEAGSEPKRVLTRAANAPPQGQGPGGKRPGSESCVPARRSRWGTEKRAIVAEPRHFKEARSKTESPRPQITPNLISKQMGKRAVLKRDGDFFGELDIVQVI